MAAIGGIGGATQGVRALQDTGGVRLSMGAESGASFADAMKGALGEVSGLQAEARDVIGAFVRGEPVEIHEVMAATEEAGLALDLLIEIRNKLSDAYRSVMQMQS